MLIHSKSKLTLMTVTAAAALWAHNAHALDFEFEAGGQLGVETYTSKESTSTETEAEKKLNSPLIYGGHAAGRLLFPASRTLMLSLGVGAGFDLGSASVSVDGVEAKNAVNRFTLEPQGRVLYLATSNIGLGLGLGYFITLSGGVTSTISGNGSTFEAKASVKSMNALRLRASAAYLLGKSTGPQLVGSYQLTAAGALSVQPPTAEGAEEPAKVIENTFSGHAFVLSYVHPIVSRSAYQNDSQNEDMSGDGQQMRRGKNSKSGNKRQRKAPQRYRDPGAE